MFENSHFEEDDGLRREVIHPNRSTHKNCSLLFDYTYLIQQDMKEGNSVFKPAGTQQFIDQVKFNNPDLTSEELIIKKNQLLNIV